MCGKPLSSPLGSSACSRRHRHSLVSPRPGGPGRRGRHSLRSLLVARFSHAYGRRRLRAARVFGLPARWAWPERILSLSRPVPPTPASVRCPPRPRRALRARAHQDAAGFFRRFLPEFNRLPRSVDPAPENFPALPPRIHSRFLTALHVS